MQRAASIISYNESQDYEQQLQDQLIQQIKDIIRKLGSFHLLALSHLMVCPIPGMASLKDHKTVVILAALMVTFGNPQRR